MSRNMFRNSAFSIVLALSLASPLAAKTPAPAASIERAALPNVAIDNFGKVSDTYYRGAQPKGRDFAALKNLGVKMVIDLAAEGDRAEASNVETAGMKFVRIPLTTSHAPSQATIDQFIKLVDDPANQPVYVHCMGGRHRTGAMTAVYRMTHDSWTADQAFSEMKQFRFGADFLHPELKNFVYTYFSQIDKSGAPKVLVATALQH